MQLGKAFTPNSLKRRRLVWSSADTYDAKFKFANTGTNATAGTVNIPVNASARGYWHTHQNPNLGQGPSDFDSAGVVNVWKKPMIIESIDSLFLIRASGSAIGCKK